MAQVAQHGERRAWREAPTTEALAFDRWRLGSAIGGEPGEARVVRPGAFGLWFDLPAPLRFLDRDGRPVPGSLTDDGIAILGVSGPLEHHASWWASYDDLAREVEIALRWPATRALILKIDSPGGVVAGMGQAHRAIRRLQRETGKRVVAWVDESACSAAYCVASACSEIWMPPEAQVGSIGVILCTIDETEHLKKEGIAVRYLVSGRRKADMHPGTAITDEVIEVAQAKVDQLADGFFRTTARARGMTPDAVADLEAAVFVGESAIDVGLADGISDWPAFLDTLRATLRATIAPERGTGGTPGARTKAKDRTMKLTAMQAAQRKTAAELAVANAEKAYEAKPTETNLDALNARRGELAKVIHHMKHEEKTVQVDDAEPPTGKPGSDVVDSSEEEDEEAEDEGGEPEDAKGKKAKGKAKGEEPKKDEEAEDGADEEEESKALAAFSAADARYRKAARTGGFDAYGVHGPLALFKACQKLTGEKTIAGVFGALAGLRTKLAASTALEKDVKELQAKRRTDEIIALVDKAKLDGKTQGKEHRAELREIGKTHGVAALKAAIKVLPAVARSRPHEAREDGGGLGAFGGSEAQREAEIEAAAVAFSSDPKAQVEFKERLRANLKAATPKIPAA